MKKRILSIFICLFLLLSLTACGGGDTTPSHKAFDTEVKSSAPSGDEVIAQNSKYTLQYISSNGSVTLIENTTGTQWEVCPSPSDETKKKNSFVQSVLKVGYSDININGGGNLDATTYSDVLSAGRMVYKPIENGVTIEYYFDQQQFMIPVDFVLKDDYLSISVNTKNIQETKYQVTYVSLAPFLCAVENDMPDSYLFMPSGSGALLDNSTYSRQGLSYSTYVYGEDLSMEETYDEIDEVSVRMPVYGYKQGDVGGFAIIDNGAETTTLNAIVGNSTYNFSAIYPSIQVRSFTQHQARTFNSTYYTNIFPGNMIDTTVSVRFYPLSGENANYDSMADIYRDYLINECGLTKIDNDKTMSVSLIGGTEITKSFVGIPYKTVYPTTTVNQAKTIVSELSESISDLSVKLKGFGESGIDIGKIGGNYKLSDNIGSASDLKSLSSLCSESNIDLYMDYELVKFNSSGAGFSFSSDVVINTGYTRADEHIIDKAIRKAETDMKYRLLRPIQFSNAVSKAVDQNSKWQLGGISLDSLTSLSYSDYTDYSETVEYNSKVGFGKAVADAASFVKENGQKFMASDANDYAAVLADVVTDAPVYSNDGYAFVEDVPFYAMVFKGYVPMTTESVNLATTPEKIILGAVEGGMGLNYTLTYSWDNSLIDAVYPYFYSTVYSSVKDDVIATYNDLSDYYESINGATIKSNTIIESGVHCTEFDNGVKVYVNYNDTAVQTPAGEVEALDYIITGGVA